jgi:hypothetical protein
MSVHWGEDGARGLTEEQALRCVRMPGSWWSRPWLTCLVFGSGMSQKDPKLVIKLRAYDSHALKCAALAAAMKEEIILDKVPLATALKGVPLLTTAAVREHVG